MVNYPPLEKLNWLIHLQHVRGENGACKELINREIAKSNSRNEYAYYKKVNQFNVRNTEVLFYFIFLPIQGTILCEEGKVQEALETFQICLKLNPENTDNLKAIGKCLLVKS